MKPGYLCRSRNISLSCALSISCLLTGISSGEASDDCLSFQTPLQGAQIKTNLCTLSVKACDKARSVAFRAKYIGEDGKTLKLNTLGNITRAPFKIVWDLSSLPNQLEKGITFYADATLSEGKSASIKREGVFLTHKPVETFSHVAAYRPKSTKRTPKPLPLSSNKTSAKARAFFYWSEEALGLRVEVRDPLFYNSLPKNKLSKIGVEIFIDPQMSASAYLSPDILAFWIPVATEKAMQIIARPVTHENGSFEIKKTTKPVSIKSDVSKADFKGYTANCVIPWSVFKNGKPKVFACNVTAKALDKVSNIQTLSLLDNEHQALYSPFLWGAIKVGAKPLFANSYLLWLVSMIIGLALGFFGALGYRNLQRYGSPQARFEHSEEDKRLYDAIKEAVHEQVTDRSLSLQDMAVSLAAPPQKVERLIRRNHQESFKSYLMRARIEIAKERLRSSHSSEASIASSCGFTDIDEMEKYFRKFCRTTPYKFREEYQVT